jgi:LPS biosynthesis protein
MGKHSLSPEEIRKAGLEALVEIDRVSKLLGLKCFLAYGTLLGAVRHKGFIPWDDDIDVWIFREDLEKLSAKFNEVCAPEFRLFTYRDEGFPYAFPKVFNLKTSVGEIGLKNIPHLGVWVDIFPLDAVPENVDEQSKELTRLEHVRWLNLFSQSACWHKLKLIGLKLGLPDTKFSDLAHKPQATLEEYNRVLKWSGNPEMVRTATSIPDMKKRFPASWFGNGTALSFEGIEFTVPSEYDKILSLCYGDYMKLPPLVQQKFVKHLSYSRYNEGYQREM